MATVEVYSSQVHKSQKERICTSCGRRIMIGDFYALLSEEQLCCKCFVPTRIVKEVEDES